MSELVWFVQVIWDDGENAKPRVRLLRAHTWQDAYDTIILKARFSTSTWGLYPLENDGSYFAGNHFEKIALPELMTAGWEERK